MPRLKTLPGALAAIACAVGAPAFAWAPEGHTVIARVAVGKLSSQAGIDLQWILSVGIPALNARMPEGKCQIDASAPWGPVPDFRIDKDMHTNLANWPDCWRTVTAATRFWHFDDIPLGDSPSGPLAATGQTWCAKGCVSKALADNLQSLASGTLAPADAAMALAFVVHFVGDIHQPLHAEDNNGDAGGTLVRITTDGAGVAADNMHILWDDPLVSAALGSDLDAATMQVANDVAAAPADWTAGTDTVSGVIQVSDIWVEEAHALAQQAYAGLNIAVNAGPVSQIAVTKDYVGLEAPVVEGQLDRAAVRLSAALNAALTWAPPTQ